MAPPIRATATQPQTPASVHPPLPPSLGAPVQADRLPSSTLTEDEISELRMAFQLFDTDNSGFIDPSELKEALVSLGFDSKNASVL